MAIDLARLEQLFSEALAKPQVDRAGYLDQACGDDSELRRRVDALLAAHDNAGSFLAPPPPGSSPTLPAVSERPGSTIGRYKLLQLIGEGGMGVVFMAEQEHPVRRRVALKVIKPGMDSRQVIARFEAERQALALMDHPHIAKVLDAGATDSGRPYFVMELVRGTPITDYCDQHQFTTRERLELLVPVCQAVQHAHGKGIIHRDLKPSNVLITIADGKPVPKVIDFGVAKATQSRLTEKTLFTEFRQLLGTPQYMSPEQAETNGIDVDTRSDVYSLGVLLYELLTGTTPLDGKELRSKAYVEMERMIRESESPAPSTRLSTLGHAAKAIATQRKTEPHKLNQLLRGEVDWIVLKALEKDRSRRYETANGMARDIQRYLADEPVEACPPSTIYKLRKFVRKHHAPLVIAASLLIVLPSAAVISTWQAIRATHAQRATEAAKQEADHQRDKAIAEKQRADQQAAIAVAVNDFLNKDILGQADVTEQPKGINPDPDIKIRDALDRAASTLADRFKSQPLVEASIRRTIGNAYSALDQYDKALQQLEAALRLSSVAAGDQHPETLHVLSDLGGLYGMKQGFERGEHTFLRALSGQRIVLGGEHRDTVETIRRLATLYLNYHKYDKAEELTVDAFNTSRHAFGDQDPRTLELMSLLGAIHDEMGKDDAEMYLTRALEAQRKVLGEQSFETTLTAGRLGRLYSHQYLFEKVERLRTEMLDYARRYFGSDSDAALTATNDLAVLYANTQRYEKAIPMFEEVLRGVRNTRGEESADCLTLMSNLASVHALQKQFDKAEALWRETIAIRRKHAGPTDPTILMHINRLADLYIIQEKYEKVRTLIDEDLANSLLTPTSDDLETRIRIVRCFIISFRGSGDNQQATLWSQKLHDFLAIVFGARIDAATLAIAGAPTNASLFADRGRLLARLGRFEEAARDFSKAIDLGPEDHLHWHQGIPLLLQVGDFDGFHRRRTQALQRFKNAREVVVAHRIAKDALMIPLDRDDLKMAVDLADRAFDADPNGGTFQTKGMAEYRKGNYNEAIGWLVKSRDDSIDNVKFQIIADEFIAMAHHHLGNSDEAQSAMKRALRKMEIGMPRIGVEDLGPWGYQDWIMCQLLRREAESLINPAMPGTRRVGN